MITAGRALELTLEVERQNELAFAKSVETFLEEVERQVSKSISNAHYNTTIYSDKPMRLLEEVGKQLLEFGFHVTLVKSNDYTKAKHEMKIFWHSDDIKL